VEEAFFKTVEWIDVNLGRDTKTFGIYNNLLQVCYSGRCTPICIASFEERLELGKCLLRLVYLIVR
jgi:hypothetical protein